MIVLSELRKHERYECNIAVELTVYGRSFTSRILDISPGGAALQTVAVPMSAGDQVTMASRKHGILSGAIQWKGTMRFGVEFDAGTKRSKELAALISGLQEVA